MADSRERELDKFWDIESLLPLRKKTPLPPRRSVHVDTVEMTLDAPSHKERPRDEVCDAPLSLRRASNEQTGGCNDIKTAAAAPDAVYAPIHPLIHEVRIYRWRSSFRFYERFCDTAARLFDCKGQPCESVPFFSYMPQYDQMNRAQLAWYLYWRDRVRAEEYPDTDYSYIFLYLFEIINLPDKIPPQEGQVQMCRIWQRYRTDYPLLNRYLADWICDYSLIHRLPPPVQALEGKVRLIAEQSSFKEFYACPTGNDASRDAQIYLLFCTNYDYKKSKLYVANREQAAAMDKHIPAALSAVLYALQEENSTFSDSKMQKATLSRDSFIGALCSNEMKRRIEVDFCSFNRSHELRFLITDIIKYTENKLRASFAVKSKLSIYALPDRIKNVIDAYVDRELPTGRRHEHVVSPRPDYEALYDLPKTELSFEHAAEIEQSSWTVTRQLVEAFEDEPSPSCILPGEETKEINEGRENHADETAARSSLLFYRDFLLAALSADGKGQRQLAASQGLLPDAIAEQINNMAVEEMGDIILEQLPSGVYTVIEDYTDDVMQMLK